MAKKQNNISKPTKKFSLLKAIQGKKQGDIKGESKLYRANITTRDANARKFISENVSTSNSGKILPGTLVMFNYFTPQLQEELEYYDAMPCTIFFGLFNSSKGPRVLGWNLHYYPPKLRFQLMDKIFNIFKKDYINLWGQDKTKNALNSFNYNYLMKVFKSNNLDFGIREYIPGLMHNIRQIPPEYFQKAVFTEGRFMKRTRDQILKYWRDQNRMIETMKKF